MSGESRAWGHEALVRELRLLREKGLTRIRYLDLPALQEATQMAGLGAPDGDVSPMRLERLLWKAVQWLGGGPLEEAALYTFGLAQGTRGLPAQDRRRRAASAYGIGTERFRKAYEQVVIDQVAEGISSCVEQARERQPTEYRINPDRPRWLLPIYTGGGAELWDALITDLDDPRSGVILLYGPRDSGKSTMIRAIRSQVEAEKEWRCLQLRMADLSSTKIVEILDNPPDLLIIDDTDLAAGGESSLRRMFYLIHYQLIYLVSARIRIILIIELMWARRFTDSYRLTVAALIGLACPETKVSVETIRPYSPIELNEALEQAGLPPAAVDHSLTYFPGTVAILRALNSVREVSEFPSHAELVVLKFGRWIERVEDAGDSDLRRRLLGALGCHALERPGVPVALQTLRSDLDIGDPRRVPSAEELAEIASGLLTTRSGRVSFASPLEEDVAAAEALLASARTGGRLQLSRPLAARVIDVAADLSKSNRALIAEAIEDRLAGLRGAPFEEIGYDVCALAVLLMRLRPDAVLDLSGLCLQGPPHIQAEPVLAEIQDELRTALISVMRSHVAELWVRLEALMPDHASCRHGDPVPWRTARAWAQSLAIRPTLEPFAQELSPQRSWRYEDILDVSVTGASTALLRDDERSARRVLRRSKADSVEVLADLWDGMNDGCWDQVTADRAEYVDALTVPAGFTGVLRLTGSRVQRAQFGAATLRGWKLSDCDLLLTDLRSCRAVERADLTAANWWSAMLNPADRYRLSAEETSQVFVDWCAAPPWTNPFYPGRWPDPFGTDNGDALS